MSDEAGFTLVELLVTVLIGGIVLAAATTLLSGSARRADDAQARAQAIQDARVGVDAVTRDLRTQACLRTSVPPKPPIISGTASSVTFYLDYGAPTGVERRQLTLSSDGVLRETRWTDPVATGAGTTRTLGDDFAAPSPALFTFYAYNPSTGAADAPLAVPLTATTAATVARIGVALQANPAVVTRSGGRSATPIVDDVFVRLTDPDGSPVPQCA